MIEILEGSTINDVDASTIIMTETTTMKTIITPEMIREEAGVSKIVAVSYTHLDVYKRQEFILTLIP